MFCVLCILSVERARKADGGAVDPLRVDELAVFAIARQMRAQIDVDTVVLCTYGVIHISFGVLQCHKGAIQQFSLEFCVARGELAHAGGTE